MCGCRSLGILIITPPRRRPSPDGSIFGPFLSIGIRLGLTHYWVTRSSRMQLLDREPRFYWLAYRDGLREPMWRSTHWVEFQSKPFD